jgi:hypothetical protein
MNEDNPMDVTSYLIALVSVNRSSICDPRLFIAALLGRNMYENLLCCFSFTFCACRYSFI